MLFSLYFVLFLIAPLCAEAGMSLLGLGSSTRGSGNDLGQYADEIKANIAKHSDQLANVYDEHRSIAAALLQLEGRISNNANNIISSRNSVTNTTAYLSTRIDALDTITSTKINALRAEMVAINQTQMLARETSQAKAADAGTVSRLHDHILTHSQQLLVLTNTTAATTTIVTHLAETVHDLKSCAKEAAAVMGNLSWMQQDIASLRLDINREVTIGEEVSLEQRKHASLISAMSTSLDHIEQQAADRDNRYNATSNIHSLQLVNLQQQTSQAQTDITTLSAASASNAATLTALTNDVNRISTTIDTAAALIPTVTSLSKTVERLENTLSLYEKRIQFLEVENERLRSRSASQESLDELRKVVFDIQSASAAQSNKVIDLVIQNLAKSMK